MIDITCQARTYQALTMEYMRRKNMKFSPQNFPNVIPVQLIKGLAMLKKIKGIFHLYRTPRFGTRRYGKYTYTNSISLREI